MKNEVIVKMGKKQYRFYRASHPCRDKRACSLFERGVCDSDGVYDNLPCEALYLTAQDCGVNFGINVCFKEVTK